MKTKKVYLAPCVKAYSYRTEDGFYNTNDWQNRFEDLLGLDFYSQNNNQETWTEETTFGSDNGWTWQ